MKHPSNFELPALTIASIFNVVISPLKRHSLPSIHEKNDFCDEFKAFLKISILMEKDVR